MKKRMTLVLASLMMSITLPGRGFLTEVQAADSERPFKPFSKEVRGVLDNSEKFILLSVNPSPIKGDDKRESFYGHRVLGKLEIKDSKLKRELLTALNAAVEKGCEEKAIPSCFNPRHGITAIAGTNEVNLLICFECMQIYIIRGNEKELTLVTHYPAGLFNGTLHEAGVPLAQQ